MTIEWGRTIRDKGRLVGPWHAKIGTHLNWACYAKTRGDVEWGDFPEPPEGEKVCGRCRHAAFRHEVAEAIRDGLRITTAPAAS